MKKNALRGALASAAVALALVPATASAATAEPVTCEGVIANQTVGDVFVPYGADCTLKRVRVLGSVTTAPDAGDVNILAFSRVQGDVTTDTAGALTVRGLSAIEGNVFASESDGAVRFSDLAVVGGYLFVYEARGGVSIAHTAVGGDLTVLNSRSETSIRENVVAGSLLLQSNFAPTQIKDNIVLRTLDCTDNDPAPTGSGNQAALKSGQCAAF